MNSLLFFLFFYFLTQFLQQKNKRKKLAKDPKAPKEKLKRKEAAMDMEEKLVTKSRKITADPNLKLKAEGNYTNCLILQSN